MKVIRCAQLNLEFDLAQAQKEVAALPDVWRAHFQQLQYDGEWTVLPLRSPGGGADDILPFALGNSPAVHADTPLLALCPAIAALLGSLKCPVLSARLLNLKRGATIHPHRDVELAFENGEARIHFPIFTNPGVEFVIDDQRVVMAEGSAWYVNANLTHQVANRGDADRIHLVVDCQVDDWLRELFARARKFQSEIRRDPQVTQQMIAQLRLMNTPTSLRMAEDLERELASAS
jgi:mannose-6-phosphate isomerase-like protein (cupin superfamily)